MRIAVLGAGAVGGNLARRATQLGHEVVVGARDPSSQKVLGVVADIPSVRVTDQSSAVAGADLVILAVPFGAVLDVVDSVAGLDGSIVVDATNAVGVPLPNGAPDIPAMIHHHRPDLTVVKAFNTIGAEAFLDPVIDGRRCFLPIAGPSPAADIVRDLAEQMGFDALVVGDIDTAELLESHARLWIHLAFRTGLGRDFGFARLERGG